jgi:hypothetical protein
MLKIIPSFPQCVVIADTESNDTQLTAELLRLECLRVLQVDMFRQHSIYVWMTLFEQWTQIRELLMRDCPPYLVQLNEENLLSEDYSFLPSLQVLKVGYCCLRAPCPPTTPNTLRILVLQDLKNLDASLLTLFLRRHAMPLRRVFLGTLALDGSGGNCLNDIGIFAPNLEYLYIHHTPAISKSILPKLPVSLVDASLDLSAEYIEPETMRDFIMKRTSDNLSMLKEFAVEMTLTPPQIDEWGKIEEDFEADRLEKEWLPVQKEAEEHNLKFFCTIHPNGSSWDIPIYIPVDRAARGSGHSDDPDWSLLA